MNWTLLATRVVLSGVFLTAGLAKLLDPKGSKKAIQDFGLPLWVAKPLGFGVPAAEITVAFLLLPVRSAEDPYELWRWSADHQWPIGFRPHHRHVHGNAVARPFVGMGIHFQRCADIQLDDKESRAVR